MAEKFVEKVTIALEKYDLMQELIRLQKTNLANEEKSLRDSATDLAKKEKRIQELESKIIRDHISYFRIQQNSYSLKDLIEIDGIRSGIYSTDLKELRDLKIQDSRIVTEIASARKEWESKEAEKAEKAKEEKK